MALGNFLSELKRRHVIRAAAAYAAVSFALIEVVSNVAPGLLLPNWTIALVVVLLLVGFPITMLAVWMRELGPADGPVQTGKLDWALMAALVLVIGLVTYNRFAPAHGTITAQQGAPAKLEATAGGISIAVLPFLNLSSDKEQEFFSDGMTEEITSALAEVKSLKVVGRTSAFQFKGENKDLRAIGQALGAANLLEGSVRKAGDRVRITGQLIRAADGTHIWTASYDRDLKDVFAVQEEVAKAIAAALQVPLGLKEGETLVANRTSDTDSYQDYLRAKALVRDRRRGTPLDEPIGLLERAVEHNANYAPAWALLAQTYALAPTSDKAFTAGPLAELRRIAEYDLVKAEAAARHAIALDARSANGYVALALTLANKSHLVEAEDYYKQALNLDAYDADGLHFYGLFLASVGKLNAAIAVRKQLQSIEPLVPVYNFNTALTLWTAGQSDLALAMYDTLRPGESRARGLALAYAAVGRYDDAAKIIENERISMRAAGAAEGAARLLRRAPRSSAEDRALPELGELDFVYLSVGLSERALDFTSRLIKAGYRGQTEFVHSFHPSYAPVRKTQLFKKLTRDSGLFDYWRARGWPDMCRPLGADDFECS